MSNKVRDEIIHPFPNLNGFTVEVETGKKLLIHAQIKVKPCYKKRLQPSNL